MGHDDSIKDTKLGEELTRILPMATKMHVNLEDGTAGRKEWRFDRYFFIGRKKSAEVCIRAPQVSRIHAVVFNRNGKWLIQDLKSSNGTIVNGDKILGHSNYELGSHNKVQLSKTGPWLNLHIEALDDSVRPVHERNLISTERDLGRELFKGIHLGDYAKTFIKKWRKYLMAAVPAIIFGLILVGYLSRQEGRESTIKLTNQVQPLNNGQNRNTTPNKEARVAANSVDIPINGTAPNPPQERVTDTAYYNNQASSAGGGNEHESKNDLNEIAKLYYTAAEKFSKNRHWQPATEYYHMVSKINPVYPELDGKIVKATFESENQRISEEAVAHIGNGQYEQGIDDLGKITEKSVYYPEALQMISDAEKAMAPVAKKRGQENADKKLAVENQKAQNAIDQALSLYIIGKIDAAVTAMDRLLKDKNRVGPDIKKRATGVKTKINNSRALYLSGYMEYQEGNFDMASDTLTQLLKADQKLIGDNLSYFAKRLGRKIADQYGEKAMAVYLKGEFAEAYDYSKKALKFNENNSKALDINKMLVEKSKQLYQDGFILEKYNHEKAMEKWRLILDICSPGSVYYKKAMVTIGKQKSQ